MESATSSSQPEPKKRGRPEEPLVIPAEDAEGAIDRFLGKKRPEEGEGGNADPEGSSSES